MNALYCRFSVHSLLKPMSFVCDIVHTKLPECFTVLDVRATLFKSETVEFDLLSELRGCFSSSFYYHTTLSFSSGIVPTHLSISKLSMLLGAL